VTLLPRPSAGKGYVVNVSPTGRREGRQTIVPGYHQARAVQATEIVQRALEMLGVPMHEARTAAQAGEGAEVRQRVNRAWKHWRARKPHAFMPRPILDPPDEEP